MDLILAAVVVVVLGTATAAAVRAKRAVVFTLSAYVEELLFRVLMLGGLVRLTGRPWLALTVMALAVGAFHVATTAHTTVISVASSTLGGVMYGVAFLRTGTLARRWCLRPGGQRAVAGRSPGDHRTDRGRHGTGSPFTRYFQ